MTTFNIVLGAVLLVVALFLIIAVLMQNGKSHGLSGAISGGAETFFGKQKGSTIDKKLSKITTVVAIVFVLIVLVIYVAQDQTDYQKMYDDYINALQTADANDDEKTEDTGKQEADTKEADGETEVGE